MHAPALTTEQAEALIDELAAALEEMVDRTCVDMAPLWADATRDQRAYFDVHAKRDLGFTPSRRYLQLSKGARSKYRGLAAWRHAVIWRSIARRIEDDTFRDAMLTMYFTPFPENAPPYAWSSRASSAPGVERFGSASTLKNLAKEGCWHAVAQLRADARRLQRGADYANELRVLLLRPATRDSLREELKLEDLDPWEDRR